ncbi:MAG: Glycosyl transferase family 2 [Candidatus Beckwithbacteria bacterium GW2011_GWB1_47_15]|uniref:Glycosyl transferase family 2 n=1 Tax=Candidatus Beckwithbacteria bacterium GW2011_GWB1_47_15 TaxID=1618371 RepID=A0A0G1UTF6_9BACT|nr:MAG: glycosyl transferase family protein [Candidatus Beckwithbacteria bacterium GW2011_GWC1_49_16]KKU35751.1 MAG: Glycosyl transferase family 2 [Candidatus Beckwithbacteria bacterium GW2011_GWA1_46_30]KKU61005.1 MAG: Glycosyl transferase family 2 [Candidatus Beckwithbacteria bacterium GW2011_GWB1_47_15]KKU72310.1 MAG: Glycosyl transferase family 2 [Candidatus Beckwithbacteria bacterium GW2011_GWA2_47_25]KKW04930.1 MAG: Glycosyl transferase family 2 [Candidatus Beckwithbacteria bacterium GW20
MSHKLSIVIPAYNELDNFKAGSLKPVVDYIKSHPGWEVILVDDGSRDGLTAAISAWIKDKPQFSFIQNPHQGKAAAVASGVAAAKNPWVLISDFDQATPISEVEKLLPFISKGYQLVIGSREAKGALREQEPWYRHLMGKVFNLLVQIVAVRGIHDTQCGFKLFDTKLARQLFNRLKVYRPRPEKHAFTGAFDVELLYLAVKRGIQVAEVPVHWKHAPTTRVSPVRDSIRMFLDVLKIRLTDLAGGYRQHEA